MKTMRIILVVMTISFLPSSSKTPVQVNAKTTRNSESSLIVEFSPSVMTAGVVNEFIDAREPFTITVRDSQGVPVDLTNGGKNDARTVWNKCFLDPHPDNQEYYGKDAKLPQYYWTRTDMHNDDGTAVCNKKLFGKDFIEINFSQASKGVYIFNNFVANDRGEFKVYVKTLDGKKEGNCNVRMERPRVDYYIINIEDNMLVPYATPGDPDFVMTAADNRIYRVRPTCYTANGRLIKGGDFGGINPARFAPMLQMPGNTLWAKEPDQKNDRNIYGSGTCKYLTNIGGRYSLNIGCDFNGDYRIIEEDNEKFSFGPQQIYDISLKKWTSYLTYYSCFNTYSDSSGYSTKPAFDMPVGNNKG